MQTDSLYSPLLNQKVLLKLSTNHLIAGKLVSIDGYVNVALAQCVVIGHDNEKTPMSGMVVKGSCVAWIKIDE